MQSLKGKVAIITGASSGIGAGIAQYFARQGARLSLAGRNEDNLKNEASKTNLPQSEILTTVGDVASEGHRKQLVDRTVEKFGQIDVLVNNAGTGCGGLMENIAEDGYDNVMNTNLKGPVMLSKLTIPHLINSKGNIINISSAGTSMVLQQYGVYFMSKVALDAYTKVLAAELGPRGVRVNSVNPGFVPTGFIERENITAEVVEYISTSSALGRGSTPEEIAQTVAFLASDLASFVTGELLYADGGIRLMKG